MSLSEYGRKRDRNRTPEPFGSDIHIPRPAYVIQRHEASKLHWDLRLEYGGVLKSWALPKEPPKEYGVKRLAVQTEDHPLEYATYEGTIPDGEYGAGEVEIWDKGTHETLETGKGKYVVKLKGERLKATYVLIQTGMGGRPENWLFFRKKEG